MTIMRHILPRATAFVVLALAGIMPVDAEQATKTIFAGEALLIPGKAPAKDVLIKITGNKITNIAADQEKPQTSNLIDLSCCFVMPGLIDVQTHLESEPGLPSRATRMTEWTDADFTLHAMLNARNTLNAGFTTIRDMGHHGQSVFAVHDAIEKGRIMGPRMQVAGEVIRPVGGELRSWLRPEIEPLFQPTAVCNGPYDCKRAVRAEAARGATTIKVETKQDLSAGTPSQFDLAELVAIREAAHELGLKVTASAFSTPSINLPLQAGFDGVVHGTYVDDETLRFLSLNDAYYIPTLLAARVVKEMAENPNMPVSDSWRRENLDIYNGMIDSFKRALRARVKIAFGTDAGWRPHGGNAEQMVQMVELGMPPADVIKAATLNAAAAMGWDGKVGALRPDHFADIIATKASPLENMHSVMSPVFVMKDGQIVRQETSP